MEKEFGIKDDSSRRHRNDSFAETGVIDGAAKAKTPMVTRERSGSSAAGIPRASRAGIRLDRPSSPGSPPLPCRNTGESGGGGGGGVGGTVVAPQPSFLEKHGVLLHVAIIFAIHMLTTSR